MDGDTKKIFSYFLLFLLLFNILPLMSGEADNCESTPILGYELLDDGQIFHMWNKYDDYYFDVDSGIQITNHYNEYWTHNVMILMYYAEGEWFTLYRTDELTGFTWSIDTDNSSYINITGYRDLSYDSYNFRLAICYSLLNTSNNLTVIPYIKNLGGPIPYNLGFGWEIKDIKIGNIYTDNTIKIDNNIYDLHDNLDLSFTDMDNSIIYLENEKKYLYFDWADNLDYLLKVKQQVGQYNCPTTLYIKIGTLASGQEKYTSLYWYDSPSYEDLTTFTEVDGEGVFTVNSTRCTSTHIQRGTDNCMVYKDYGVNNFNNFTANIDIKVTYNGGASSAYSTGIVLGFANSVGDLMAVQTEQFVGIYISGSGSFPTVIYVGDWVSGVEDYRISSTTLGTNTPYYLTIKRSSSVLTVSIYSNFDRTTLLENITFNDVETTSWRYCYVGQSCDFTDITTNDISFYSENLEFVASDLPSVSTENVTNITASTATLNGILSDLGNKSSAIVWFEYGTTTGYGSKTNNQTLTSPMFFQDSISSLTGNTTYHYRAVANNTNGTVHGNDLTFRTYYVPEAPINTNYSIINSSTINLTWTKAYCNNTVVVKKTGSMPSDVTDGIIVYNGTGNYTFVSFSDSSDNYFKAWSYSFWPENWYSYSTNGTIFNIGGLQINCYDAENNTNITFNVSITNQDGSSTYNAFGCTNTKTINASLCPQGEVTIIISSNGYSDGRYYLTISENIFYLLNAYLLYTITPPTPSNQTYLYRLIVYNEKNQPEQNVLMRIKKQVNLSDFQIIHESYTDASGNVYVWLSAEQYYIVYLNKTGFQDQNSPFIPSNLVFEYTFKIYYEEVTPQPPIIEYEDITFTCTYQASNTLLKISYNDISSYTLSASIHITMRNTSSGLWEDLGIFNYTSQSWDHYLTDVNRSNTYVINLTYNHEFLGTLHRTFVLEMEYTTLTTPAESESIFSWVGIIPFGITNFLMWLFLIASLYYADGRDAGKIIIIVGVIFIFIGIFINFNNTLLNIAGISIPTLFIVMGVLMEWNEAKKKGV